MNFAIEIDSRMISKSGIGRYLRAVLHGCPRSLKPRIILRGEHIELDGFASVIDRAGVYGLIEQISRVAPCGFLFWTPHYNFPLLRSGAQVITVHDLAHLALPDIFGRGIKRLYAQLYFYLILTRVDHVIFVSQFTVNEFQRIMGRLPRSYNVVHNGVGREWFLNVPRTVRNAANSGVKFSILAVGNIKPHKNLVRLINALRSEGESGRLELRIVGKASGFRTNELICPEVNWLVWVGEVSDEALKSEYQRADCFVMPSLYEGFGLPILEAMAGECPVAVSDILPFREICGPLGSDLAEFFSPIDEDSIFAAVSRIMSMSERDLTLRTARAKEHARQMSWERCADRIWATLESICSRIQPTIL